MAVFRLYRWLSLAFRSNLFCLGGLASSEKVRFLWLSVVLHKLDPFIDVEVGTKSDKHHGNQNVEEPMSVILRGQHIDLDPARQVAFLQPEIERAAREMELEVGVQDKDLESVDRGDGTAVVEGTVVDCVREIADVDLAIHQTFEHG